MTTIQDAVDIDGRTETSNESRGRAAAALWGYIMSGGRRVGGSAVAGRRAGLGLGPPGNPPPRKKGHEFCGMTGVPHEVQIPTPLTANASLWNKQASILVSPAAAAVVQIDGGV
jgi:hypothetical protein